MLNNLWLPSRNRGGNRMIELSVDQQARKADRHLRLIDTGRSQMPNETLGLADAKRMLNAAEAKAEAFGIAYNIAVVDAGAHLIAFVRQDEGLIGSIDLAIKKAITARIFNKTTAYLGALSQPGQPLFGIHQSNNGNVIVFGGGIPVVRNGQIVGAVGASSGSAEQDIAVSEAAIAAIGCKPWEQGILRA